MKFQASPLTKMMDKDKKKLEEAKKAPPKEILSPEKVAELAALGCSACPLKGQWPLLKNARMQMHSPSASCQILIVGEAPTELEDEKGFPFLGKTGKLLRNTLEEVFREVFPNEDFSSCYTEMEKDFLFNGRNVWWTNTVRCHPPGNKSPSAVEVACCSKFLEQDILAAKPKVILGFGSVPLNAISPAGKKEFLSITTYRGTSFPVLLEGHASLFIPTFNLSYIIRGGTKEESTDSFFFKEDIRMGVEVTKEATPINWRSYLFPFYQKETTKHDGWGEKDGLIMVYGREGLPKLKGMKELLLKEEMLGFDIETNQLRPYDGGEIISYSFSNGVESLSVLVNHPLITDTIYKQEVMAQLQEFLLNTNTLILAHNLMFELEWMGHFFGNELFMKIGQEQSSKFYGDTQGMKYILPSHPMDRQLALDDLCLQYMGFELKSMYDLDRSKISGYSIDQILEYNAGDAIVLPYLYKVMMQAVAHYQLSDTYDMIMNAAVASAKAQVEGLPANLTAARGMREPLEEAKQEMEEKLLKSDLFESFKQEKGRYPNLKSADDKLFILYDMYGFETVLHKKTGNPTAAKEVLYKYADIAPDLADIVALMEVEKFLEDVLGPIEIKVNKRGTIVVYKDGKIHTQFNIHKLRTMRSSSSPNVQNFPKRNPKFKRARDIIGFPPDQADKWAILGIDSGQIDFRLAGMSSLDPSFVDAVRNGLDVHALFAHHVARLSPSKYKTVAAYIGKPESIYVPDQMDPVVKAIRQDVKSGFVFAHIYRAGIKTMARTLGVSTEVIEELLKIFDNMFPGIGEWHKDLYAFYDHNKMVRSITGTLLYGPLDYGDIANYGIQHATRFLVSNMMKRLAIDHRLSVPNEVHDENMVIVPIDMVADTIKIMGEVFCNTPYEWAQVVPLTCEIKQAIRTDTGIGWGNMEKVAEYSSIDFGWNPRPIEDFQQYYERQFQKVVRKPIYFC